MISSRNSAARAAPGARQRAAAFGWPLAGLAGLTLAGCATAAPTLAPVAAAVAPVVAAPVTVEPATPAPLARLVGGDEAAVTARLGPASVARREGQGAMWTYRRRDCSVFVFFRVQDGALRVSGLDAGAGRLGVPSPDPDACAAGPAS